MTTLVFEYTHLGNNRYLRELKILGEPYLTVCNPLNLDVVKVKKKEDLKKDFEKWRGKIGKVKLSYVGGYN